jgi:hypothetical protein
MKKDISIGELVARDFRAASVFKAKSILLRAIIKYLPTDATLIM